MFGFCITHILNIECAKIWKKIRRQKVQCDRYGFVLKGLKRLSECTQSSEHCSVSGQNERSTLTRQTPLLLSSLFLSLLVSLQASKGTVCLKTANSLHSCRWYVLASPAAANPVEVPISFDLPATATVRRLTLNHSVWKVFLGMYYIHKWISQPPRKSGFTSIERRIPMYSPLSFKISYSAHL